MGACAIAFGGCQTYEASPLDLGAHRAEVVARALDTEPVGAFAARLRDSGGAAPDQFDVSDGLSAEEGEVLGLFYNSDLALARLEAGVALASLDHAGLWEDPVFGFDAAQILSPGSLLEYGLTLSLTIPISGRLGVEKDRAGAEYEAALRRIVDAEWETRAEVRRAWASWTVASEREALLREVVGQVARIASITDRLESAGELGRAEGRLFRVELAGRRAELAEAELGASRARVELLGLMGLAPDAGVELIPSMRAVAPDETDDEAGRLIEANPELAVSRAAYRVAEQTLRLEVRKQFPDLTIGAGYGNEDDDRLLLGASIPIPILNANRREIAEARARREIARAQAEATFDRLVRELAIARQSLESAGGRRVQYESEIVPMLGEQAGEVERLAELGEVDTFLLLETVGRQFDAKTRLMSLRLAEINAAIDVARLLGPDEPGAPAPVGVDDDESGGAE